MKLLSGILATGVAFGALAVATQANAADIYAPGPVVGYKDIAPISPLWTGFYIGGSVGGAWGNLSDNDYYGLGAVAAGAHYWLLPPVALLLLHAIITTAPAACLAARRSATTGSGAMSCSARKSTSTALAFRATTSTNPYLAAAGWRCEQQRRFPARCNRQAWLFCRRGPSLRQGRLSLTSTPIWA